MNGEHIMKFGPLSIIILVGVALIVHGLPKFYDMPGAQDLFGNLGLPGELAIGIAILELVEGIVILLWFPNKDSCRTSSFRNDRNCPTCQSSKGFVGGYELELFIMPTCITLFLTGPGRISLEYDVLKMEIFPRGKKIVDEQRRNSSYRQLVSRNA